MPCASTEPYPRPDREYGIRAVLICAIQGLDGVRGDFLGFVGHETSFTADVGGNDWGALIQTLDKGSFDQVAFFKMLREIGFSGDVGLQCYAVKGDPKDNLKRSIAAWSRSIASWQSSTSWARSSGLCKRTKTTSTWGATLPGKLKWRRKMNG